MDDPQIAADKNQRSVGRGDDSRKRGSHRSAAPGDFISAYDLA
jgi:hypothetical protein